MANDSLYGHGSLLSEDWQEVSYTIIATADIESMGIEGINSITTCLLWGLAVSAIIITGIFIYWLFGTEKKISPY